ncbi:MAG TPA: ParA family protein, partial [Steroidobacteraceae bacterium]
MQVISIANQKGGVGKTTLCSLLAFYLVDKRRARVLAIDLDSQRNLSHTLREFRVEVATTALFDERPVALRTSRQDLALIHATPQLANLERATAEEAHRRVQTFAAQIDGL